MVLRMKNNPFTTLVKLFAFGMLAAVLIVASFGVGLTVGAQAQRSVVSPAQQVAVPVPGGREAEGVLPATVPPPTEPPATATPLPQRTPTAPAAGPAVSPGGTATPEAAATPNQSTILLNGPVDMALLNEVWGLLQKEYYGELPQGKNPTYAAIDGLVNSLGDKHTVFLNPERADAFNTSLQGQFEGIGAQVDLADGGGIILKYLYADQPAEKAGLHVGDVVIAIDGSDATSLSLQEAVGRIRGPAGTTVRLTVRRDQDPPFDVTITRARIEIPIVSSKTLGDGKIAYVALAEFSSDSSIRLADALKASLQTKPAGLILDLRGNGGGLLSEAINIGSLFIPDGNIVIERFKDGSERTHPRQGDYLLGKTPFVILVDGGTASASEIVAGAVQDAGTGVLIGEKTYGKGSVQQPNQLSDGSQLNVTIAHWFTPKDRGIEGAGLQPDVTIPFTQADVDAKRDPQLDRAVQFLLNGEVKPTPGITPTTGTTPTPGTK